MLFVFDLQSWDVSMVHVYCLACLGCTDCSGMCACLPALRCWRWIVWCMHVSCTDSDVQSCFELWSALSQSGWIRRYISVTECIVYKGAGIAQWLERRTRDWKVAGSNPCWSGGRIFFSRVDFLCWLLFRYPFHPCVTTVARKKSRSFCQKCRWQVTAKHAYTLRMWLLLNRASALVTTCP